MRIVRALEDTSNVQHSHIAGLNHWREAYKMRNYFGPLFAGNRGSYSPGEVEPGVDESLRFVGQDVILVITPNRVWK